MDYRLIKYMLGVNKIFYSKIIYHVSITDIPEVKERGEITLLK